MKNKVKKLGVVALLISSIGVFFSFKTDDRYFEIAKNLDIFATMFRELNALYVDEVNPTKSIRTGIEAMLKDLDPYTNFFPEDDIEDYMTMTTGKYNGIGASVITTNNRRLISMIFEDSPAAQAGLKIGDEVLKINNVVIADKDDVTIGKLLKGQTGTTAILTIKRFGENKPMDVKVARGIVKTPNVPHYGMINEEVGYVQLKDFSQTAAKEVKAAISEMKEDGMKKLIFDLRGNPGGLLNMAIEISNFFLPKGQLIVETKGKVADWNKKYLGNEAPFDIEMPVVVLINSRSASASEIVSGSLQDYDRAVLIGQRSFGKGLVQTTRPLTYNTQMKITTAKYYIPSGRCIQAIDYSHRNEDGSVGKIPDSLKSAFKTKNGRVFYDGGGVEPDIYTEPHRVPDVLKNLTKQGEIFDFATKYYYENKDKKVDSTFHLTDSEYQQFKTWLLSQQFDYETNSEKQLTALVSASKDEDTYKDISPAIESIKGKLEVQKKQELDKYKIEIKEALEEEIVVRYHFSKAAKFLSFERDREVQEALKLFKDMGRYKKILAGN